MFYKYACTALAAISLAANATAAINWSSPTFSVALTNAEIEAVSGTTSVGATFFSSSVIPAETAGDLYIIQDPSGAGDGTGLIKINLTTKAGSVIANDAALNAVTDEGSPASDNDVNDLTIDPATGTVYVLDREDDDEVLAITSAGAVSVLSGVNGSGIGNSGIEFDNGGLFYLNQNDDGVKKFTLSNSTEADFVPLGAYTAVSGGSQNAFSGGPVKANGKLYIFDEENFSGSDQIMAVNLSDAAVSVHTPKSTFVAGAEPGFFTFAVTSDGTVIAWEKFPVATGDFAFVVIPGGTGTPIRISQATVASALGVANTAIDPSDRGAIAVIKDDETSVEVLFGVSGTGAIGKMTFPQASASVSDWQLFQ